MSEARDPEGRFSVTVPEAWSSAPDDDGDGMEVWKEDGLGTLHLISFESADDLRDPAEELYAFLQDRGVELEEDEVQDLPLPGDALLSYCEYVAEDEEDGEALFWLVGVAATHGTLVFATYFCPAGRQEAEAEAVRGMLATLRLDGAEPRTDDEKEGGWG